MICTCGCALGLFSTAGAPGVGGGRSCVLLEGGGRRSMRAFGSRAIGDPLATATAFALRMPDAFAATGVIPTGAGEASAATPVVATPARPAATSAASGLSSGSAGGAGKASRAIFLGGGTSAKKTVIGT
jgi:hypothetical protein